MRVLRGWFCEHQKVVAIGAKAVAWEQYCHYNRMCTFGPEGCHAIKVTPEQAAQAVDDLIPLSAFR